jgi:hypothetical protein
MDHQGFHSTLRSKGHSCPPYPTVRGTRNGQTDLALPKEKFQIISVDQVSYDIELKLIFVPNNYKCSVR